MLYSHKEPKSKPDNQVFLPVPQGRTSQWLVSTFTVSQIHLGDLFLSEDVEEAMIQDTDSDVAEPKEGGKVKTKWTQDEVICDPLSLS